MCNLKVSKEKQENNLMRRFLKRILIFFFFAGTCLLLMPELLTHPTKYLERFSLKNGKYFSEIIIFS